MDTKEIQMSLQTPDNKKYLWAFKSFGITDQDAALGLRYIKSKVRSEFKKLAKRYHPDMNSHCHQAGKFKELNRLRVRVLDMQIMPVTVDNLEIIYEITKGYQSTREYDMPFEI